MDLDTNRSLDFREFSKLVRSREMAINSEDALKQRFRDLDADNSGTVDMPEFIKFALRDGLSRTSLPIKSLLASWDTDGTGDIGLQEFRDAVRHFGFEARNQEIDAVFREFDRNDSGSLDINELEEAFTASSIPLGMKQNAIRRMSDREGALSKEQAAAKLAAASAQLSDEGRAPAYRIEQQVAELRRTLLAVLDTNQARVMDLFRAWDTNEDGLLGKKELSKALGVLGIEASPKVVTEFFKLIDKDGDGTLHYKELNAALRKSAMLDEGGAQTASEAKPIELAATTKVKIRRVASERQLSKTFGSSMQLNLVEAGVGEAAGEVDQGAALLYQLTSALKKSWGKVSKLFGEWDVNGDGLISKKEMRQAMKVLGLGSGGERDLLAIEALFASVDADDSGAISLHELSHAIRPSSLRSDSQAPGSVLSLARSLSRSGRPFKQHTRLLPPEWPHTPALFANGAGGGPGPLAPAASRHEQLGTFAPKSKGLYAASEPAKALWARNLGFAQGILEVSYGLGGERLEPMPNFKGERVLTASPPRPKPMTASHGALPGVEYRERRPWSGADLDDAFDPGLLSGGSSAVWRPALPITPQQLPRSASVGTLERHSSSVSFGTSRSAIGARSSPYPKPIAIPGRVSPSSAPRTPPAKMSPISPLSPLSPPLHASSPLGLPPLSSPSMASSPPPTSPLSPGHRLAGPGRPRGWILASGKMVGAGSTVIRRAEERTPRLQVQGRNAQPPPPMPEHAWYAAWLQAQSPGARVAVSSAEVLSL